MRRGPGTGDRGPFPRPPMALLVAVWLAVAGVAAGERVVVDDFADVKAWTAAPAEGVAATIAEDAGALRVDVDFHGGGGWAAFRRPLPLELPANYAFSFRVRGKLPPNTLEFKLVDASGENVWWSTRREFTFASEWQTVTIRKRQISFAWGPAGGGELRRAAFLELAVTAGNGGKGSVWVDDLTFTELPEVRPYAGTPRASASAELPGAPATAALDGDPATAWRSSGAPAWLAVDFGEPREYGGVVLTWSAACADIAYTIETSDDGDRWTTARMVTGSNGGVDYLALPDAESRFLRLALAGGGPVGLAEVEVMPLAFGDSPNALFAEMARRAPRGRFPRAFAGEQVYWTVVGADESPHEALLSEDGALEVGKASFSIEPFVLLDGALLGWNDVTAVHSLADGYLPIPTVTWTHPRVTLAVTALAAGDAASSTLLARWALSNPGATTLHGTLFLAVRPIQVNPPTQFLNTAGGVARVRSIELAAGRVQVNGERWVIPWTPPAAFGASTFDGGEVVEHLAGGRPPAAQSVSDPAGYASAALAYPFTVAPGAAQAFVVGVPFPGADAPAPAATIDAAAGFAAALAAARAQWSEKLDRVRIVLPGAASAFADTVRSNLAYVLVNRDGAAIQPGSRAYERSWIRDGALTSAALLRLGHEREVSEFIDWFAPFQYPSGKVPCCVDARGADPVPENDSHGELIYLIAEYFAFTHDRELVERQWDHVQRAVAYIDELRRQRRTDEYRTPETLPFFGLLPASISHEGYSAKPMHSYWDDFWALRGLEAAAELAGALGKADDRDRFAAIRDELRTDLHASLRRTIEQHHIAYVPGCAELGDYDPTSTTIAVSPGREQEALSPAPLGPTFERYWQESAARAGGTREWDAYTPYELRTVAVMVRLGWRERALAMLDFFMRDRRPAGWNQWAEVVGREPRRPRFVGDMPHTWVGSDFIRSFLDMLAYERDRDQALVVAAGVPRAWIDAPAGIVVGGLRTRWGPLSYRARSENGVMLVDIAGGMAIPAGGVLLDLPVGRPPGRVTIDGHRVAGVAATLAPIVIRSLPTHVEIRP